MRANGPTVPVEVLDALAEGVLLLGHDARVATANRAVTAMLGRDTTGLDGHAALHPGGCPAPCPLADPLALAGRRLSPVLLPRAGAAPLPVELGVSTVPGGAVLVVADLTERLRRERAQTELVCAVSHELRTPLTSVRGALGLLSAHAVDPSGEAGRRMLALAVEGTERLRGLVDDLLDLERVRGGALDLALVAQPLGPVLDAAAADTAVVAAERAVVLSVPETALQVTADAERLVQVVGSLLAAAVDASPRGTTVTAGVTATSDRVRLAVSDAGSGCTPEQLDRAFEAFASAGGGDAREQSGNGLSLALAHGLARQQGGALTATLAGGGRTFLLDLPRAGAARPASLALERP